MNNEAEQILRAVNVVSDQVVTLHGVVDDHAAASRLKTKEAMVDAMREAMRDKEAVAEFWSSAGEALMSYGQQQTGRLVIGGVKGVLSRVGMFLVLGFIVYSLGGWAAVAAVWKAIWPTGH